MSDPLEVTQGKVVPSSNYQASLITLYGVPFNTARVVVGSGAGGVDVACVPRPSTNPYKPALIYGFSYQGHIYNLPEPVITLVDIATERAARAAGYAQGSGYLQWTADKLDRTAQFQITNDTFEELILRKNVSESRQPISYHAASMISHRGGKLMD